MRIKILHVVYSFNTGGMENGLVNLINNLPQDRYEHVICVLTEGSDSFSRISGSNARLVQLNKPDRHDYSIAFKIGALVRKYRVDVVHTRNWASLLDGVVGSLSGGCNRIVHSEHGKELDDLRAGSILRTMLKRICYFKVRKLITVSNALAQEILFNRECSGSKLQTIINGVDCKRFYARSAEEVAHYRNLYGLPENSFLVGSIGRMTKVKDLEYQIDLCTMARNKAYHFVLVGDGPERARLENIVKSRGLSNRCSFLGEINNVENILSCFDAFINTSRYEGISNTILEAMASGIPVVANRVGGNCEIVKDGVTGYLIGQNRKEEFLDKLDLLRSDTALHNELSLYARDTARNEYSLETMVQKYAQMYSSVANK
jgi:sugar transferase (PEP-CTERM/EpsH1 system associated)